MKSKTKNVVVEDRAAIREEVFRRDDRRCLLDGIPGAGPCGGRLTPHHRRKDGQGGEFSVANLATLCAHHNDQLEADADLAFLARTMGLVLKRGDEWTDAHERFWAKVNRDGPVSDYRPDLGPCWIWTGAINVRHGYGYFFTGPDRATGLRMPAHRFALSCVEALVEGLEADHLCRVRACVNPRHLEQVTHEENVRRAALAVAAPLTCRKGHAMDGTQSGERVDGNPVGLCLTCRRDSWNRYARKKAAANS